MFANELAGAIEPLHADIVEVYAPMHARTRARFGHDEKGRLLKKRANIRAYSQRLIPALQRRQVG